MASDEIWNTHRVECREPGDGYRLAILTSTKTQTELANYLPTVDGKNTRVFQLSSWYKQHGYIYERLRSYRLILYPLEFLFLYLPALVSKKYINKFYCL